MFLSSHWVLLSYSGFLTRQLCKSFAFNSFSVAFVMQDLSLFFLAVDQITFLPGA